MGGRLTNLAKLSPSHELGLLQMTLELRHCALTANQCNIGRGRTRGRFDSGIPLTGSGRPEPG